MKYVKEGNKMKRPDDCPAILFELMSECWHIIPDERPTFLQICQRLLGESNERFRQTSFFHTPEGREAVINQEEMLQVEKIIPVLEVIKTKSDNNFSHGGSRRRLVARTPPLLSLWDRTGMASTPHTRATSWSA